MKRTLLAIGLALSLGASVQAKMPEGVAEPYQAYRTALSNNQFNVAVENAYEAWQNSEVLLGDSRITGDLASNFADMAPREMAGKSARKQVANAYQRSISLAYLTDTIGQEIEVQRRVDYLSWAFRRKSRDWPENAYGLDALKEKLVAYNLLAMTYEADYLALSAQRNFRRRKWTKTIDMAERSLALYDSAQDGLPSNMRYAAPVFLAQALNERGRSVDAALVYQGLMEELAKRQGDKGRISKVIAAQWIDIRDAALSSSQDNPEIDRVRNYSIPRQQNETISPIMTRRPDFPVGFRKSSKSGKVVFKFDVDKNGYVVDPVVVESSWKILHPPAKEALFNTRFPPNLAREDRLGRTYSITFILHTQTGRNLPFADMKSRS